MEHRKQLEHIEKLMTRSTRFLSLSGLSGVVAGVVAIMGAIYAKHIVSPLISQHSHYGRKEVGYLEISDPIIFKLMCTALAVLLLSAGAAFFFSYRRAKKMGASIFDQSGLHLIRAFAPAMILGGFLCFVFLLRGYYELIIPATLLFYGLALWNASKFTMDEIFYLGVSEIILGAVCTFLFTYSFYFWTLGFGVLHILYGVVMYLKYEK